MPERVGILIGCIFLGWDNFDRSQTILAVESKADRGNRGSAGGPWNTRGATGPDLGNDLNSFFAKPVSEITNVNEREDYCDD